MSAAGAGPHDEGECARAWVALHAAHCRVTECLTSALAACGGLTINDFEVLVRLSQAEPAMVKLGDLTDAVALSQPALSRLVNRLEQRGLVERSGTPEDRRAVLLGLTATGQETLRQAMPVHAACVRDELIGRLTDAEQRTLIETLSRVQPTGAAEPGAE